MDIKINCMNKNLFILIAISIASFITVGCRTTEGEKDPHNKFEVIEVCYKRGSADRIIVRDPETNVLYIDCIYSVVPVLNSDGTPKLYGK